MGEGAGQGRLGRAPVSVPRATSAPRFEAALQGPVDSSCSRARAGPGPGGAVRASRLHWSFGAESTAGDFSGSSSEEPRECGGWGWGPGEKSSV